MKASHRIQYGGVDFGFAERNAIERVLKRNWWGPADETAAFERALARKQGTKHAVFVSSGSSALEAGIAASKLPPGSEVIVPATTFPTPIASLIRSDLVPVVVDVDETLQISPEAIVKAITGRTKAILVVYVAGNMPDMDNIMEIAEQHGLEIWEDNCDGFGGTWNGQMLGSFGSFSAISTHAAHIISTGLGGAVFTDDSDIARSVRELRDWGRTVHYEGEGEPGMPREYKRYTYTETGYNMQALEMQAAMGRVQLRRLGDFKAARKENYWKLRNLLGEYAELPKIHDKADPCWHTFPMIVDDRPALVKRLTDAMIDWRPILAGNIARQPAFKGKVRVSGSLEYADKIFYKGIWLPVHPMHGEEEMITIANICTT